MFQDNCCTANFKLIKTVTIVALEVFHIFQKTWMIASTTNLFVLGCFLQVQLVDFLMFIMFSKFYQVPALPGKGIGYVWSIFLMKCEFVNVVQSYQNPTFYEYYDHNFMGRPYISLPKRSMKKNFFLSFVLTTFLHELELHQSIFPNLLLLF